MSYTIGSVGKPFGPKSSSYPVPPPTPVATCPKFNTTPLSVTLSSFALKTGTIEPIGIVELPNVALSVRKLERMFLVDILGFN